MPFLAAAAIACGGLVLPILAGLFQTLLPALGHLPAIGENGFNLDPWRSLFATPGFSTSLGLTVSTGLLSAFLALTLAAGFHASLQESRLLRLIGRLGAPLLASPHAAIAIGFAFLIAPSGWLFRIISPQPSGLSVPPDIAIVHDAAGLALICGLVIKETPFLILAIGSALNQLPHRYQVATARSLGYGPRTAWFLVIFPQVYPQVRLAIYAVLAFSLSVVDVSIILGPGTPPTIAVQTLRWYSAADVATLLTASASAILLAALVGGAICVWWLMERAVIFLGRMLMARGSRQNLFDYLAKFIPALTSVALSAGALSLLGLFIWSVTWRWDFPSSIPGSWSLAMWSRSLNDWGSAFLTTFTLASTSSLASLLLAIALLETSDWSGHRNLAFPTVVIYLPLILPQPAFIFGLHIAFLKSGVDGSILPVVWSHILFVFPYVMLALADPWRALDPRYSRSAASLGYSRSKILLLVKLPLLLRPLLTALAIGFAVSVAQYLPTLAIGDGRINTLTTEAVTLSSGGDRRVIGVFGTLQTVLPFLVYGLALILPAIAFARRKGMAGARV